MTPATRTSRGTVLALVLVVVAILAVVAAGEMFLIRSELGAQAASVNGQQARAAALSGIHRAVSVLKAAAQDPSIWRDSPELFQAQPVTGEGDQEWRFTLYAGNLNEPGSVRYGLADEAARININLAPAEVLRALPGMTDERVDCLLDFRDQDDEPRENGAEQEYYDALAKAYKINNGPLATVEELLLVKGFNGGVLYGEDANRNGALESNEDDSDESFPPDNRDGQLDVGLAALATVISYEPDVDRDGAARININTANPNSLQQQLQQAGLARDTAEFVALARRANRRFADPSELLGLSLDLPDPRNPQRTRRVSSGVDRDNLDLVMDKLTTGGVRLGRQEVLAGRVNLNTAPRQVLSALPGLDENAAQRIVDARGGLDPEARSTTAWIYVQDIVSADVFKRVAPRATVRSYQFRVRSFGYSPACGRFCVLEAVIDLAQDGRILYLRELTRLGVPLATLGELR